MKRNSRHIAFKEGYIFDVSSFKRDEIPYPTALTCTLMEVVRNKRKIEDRVERIKEILELLKESLEKQEKHQKVFNFTLILPEILSKKNEPQGVNLRAVIHQGDNQETVITIMLGNEILKEEQTEPIEEIEINRGIF